jgi:hypothetical protein
VLLVIFLATLPLNQQSSTTPSPPRANAKAPQSILLSIHPTAGHDQQPNDPGGFAESLTEIYRDAATRRSLQATVFHAEDHCGDGLARAPASSGSASSRRRRHEKNK